MRFRSILHSFGPLLILSLFALFLLTVVFPRPLYSPDYPLHLAIGKTIASCRCFPRRDTFSFTFFHHFWHLNAWLGSLTLSTFVKFFNSAGALLYKALFLFFFALLPLLKNRSKPLFFVVLITLPFFDYLSFFLDFNPFLFSFLLTLFVYWSLSQKKLTYLPLLFLLWVQLHPGFWVGIALFLLGFATRHLPFKKRNILSLTLSLLALLAHPNGPRALLYPFYLELRGNTYSQNLIMWQPFRFPDPGLNGAVLLYFATLALLFLIRKRLTPFSLAALLLSAFLPLTGVRHLPFFLLLAPLTLPEALPNRKLSPQPPLLLFPLAYASLFLFFLKSPHYQLSWLIRESTFPEEPLAFIQKNHLKGNLFHEYDWGNYLLAHHIPVFIDGRADTLYPASFFKTHWEVLENLRPYAPIFGKYQIALVLLRINTPLVHSLQKDPKYAPIYRDEQAILFMKKPLPQKKWVYPMGFYYYFTAGKRAYLKGDRERARALWKKTLTFRRDVVTVWQNLGYLALYFGDSPEAKKDFQTCLKLKRDHLPCRRGLAQLRP